MVPAAIICGLLLCFNSAHPAEPLEVMPTHVQLEKVKVNGVVTPYILPSIVPIVRQRPGNPFVTSEDTPSVRDGLGKAYSSKMSTTVVIGPGFQTLPANMADALRL